MDTKAIEEYSKWARRELIEQVSARLYALGLSASNRQPADAAVVEGKVLSDEVRAQRAELIRCIDEEGEQAFVDRMAYTWFNRLIAIRYMEVHDFLPSRTRILSAYDGSFDPQALREATSLDLPGLDEARVVDLLQRGDDEELFRQILLAQCAQLSDCMPAVFERLGAADGLTLPDRLLRKDGVVGHLVSDIPEDAWDDVEILGWMYQFYVSERKDEAYAKFDKGKKAAPEDIGPATQLFTPDWIVRYMVENSLGRLWMLNNPTSQLRDGMEYYIEPEGQVEDFIRIESPEDITFCDPACGSGHILVYAFDLLWAMYEERGYSTSDIAELILTKSLHGMEIDPRAAQYAVLQLTMKACEHDRRFLRRGVVPDICVLEPVAFDTEDRAWLGTLAQRVELLDALEHLTECGSLLLPESQDIVAIRSALDSLPHSLDGESLRARLKSALASCDALARRFDVVVANPPYLGSSKFNPWTSKWIKKNYANEKSDLCTCFIKRGFSLAKARGYSSMVTMQSWMFLSSFEKMREEIIDRRTILSVCHLGTRAFDAIAGEVVATTATTFLGGKNDVQGDYVRLVDLIGSDAKKDAYLEAIANHECGWFYRADADSFKDIPGCPIAYWASEAVHRAFTDNSGLGALARPTAGIRTGDNDRFLRFFWEVSVDNTSFNCCSHEQSLTIDQKWYPCHKGGGFRKWFGNLDYVINWRNDGEALRSFPGCDKAGVDYFFREGISWSTISSASLSVRYSYPGTISEHCGSMCFADKHSSLMYCLAMLNTSVAMVFQTILSPTLSFREGALSITPLLINSNYFDYIVSIAENNIRVSEEDWDECETSWNFSCHPLIHAVKIN